MIVVFDIESRIAVCVSTKDFIISSLERSSFWRKVGLKFEVIKFFIIPVEHGLMFLLCKKHFQNC